MSYNTPPLPAAIDTHKVFIVLRDGESFFGNVFVNHGERVQDLLNDRRRFLPVEKHMSNRGRGSEDKWAMTLINKDCISTVEER